MRAEKKEVPQVVPFPCPAKPAMTNKNTSTGTENLECESFMFELKFEIRSL